MKQKLVFLMALIFTSLLYANPVWIDVRTQEEYDEDHINGDIRISYEQIVPEVMKLFPDKEAEIHVYCRSGRRADIAMTMLQEAGYKNVSNAGGINDARKDRGLTQ